MKKCFATLLAITMFAVVRGEGTVPMRSGSISAAAVDSVGVTEKFRAKLDSLSIEYAVEMGGDIEEISDSPLFFRLFMPLTLYNDAISESMTPDDNVDSYYGNMLPLEKTEQEKENEVRRHINAALLRVYLEHPELVKMTEEELMSVAGPVVLGPEAAAGILREVNSQHLRYKGADEPELVKNKPVYWKTFGNFATKYTQSFFSDNWYKGGESSHSMLAQLKLESNYAKNQISFDNKLEAKLGYLTTKKNGELSFRTNDDLLRITSKYGVKAAQSWFYTLQFQGYTQFMPVMDKSDNLKSKFFSPAYGSLSVGMDLKPKFKNKNISLSALMSPIAYNSKYVGVDSIASKYGIKEGENYFYSLGSRVEANLKWTIMKNVKWTSRIFFYTSYENVESDWENTIDYVLSKYFTLQFFIHWKYDDSIKPDQYLNYNQLREFLTLNFTYSW